MNDYTRRRIITALNTCIEVCTDAQKGYSLAAADARDPTLKTRLLAHVKERADMVRELQDAVTAMNAMPENEGTVRGALHRGFMTARRVMAGRDDRRIVEECIRGDRAALKGYEAALRRVFFHRLPRPLHDLVDAQYSSIKRSLDGLREGYAV